MNLESTEQNREGISFDNLIAEDSCLYLKETQLSSKLTTASTYSSQSSIKRVKFNPTIEYCHIQSLKRYNANHLNHKTVKTSKDIVIVLNNDKKCFCSII